jgi:hypothetical protein
MAYIPDKFELYRLAVQHPQAEAAFLQKVYTHYARHRHSATIPTRLREDFAGTAAVAACWVALDDRHRAVAVESHGPTLVRAQAYTAAMLAGRDCSTNFHMVGADVLAFRPPRAPRVDLTVALNFSSFIYHTPSDLRVYLASARAGLRPGGLLVIDAYGGPGAMKTGTQHRRIDPALNAASAPTGGNQRRRECVAPFDYYWEQRSYDPVTALVDCRIHFRLGARRWVRNAFRYSWRLWTLPELTQLMLQAGFARAEVWCDTYDPRRGLGDGIYRVVRHMPAREDFVVYVVGLR